jgi:hypothetical protein
MTKQKGGNESNILDNPNYCGGPKYVSQCGIDLHPSGNCASNMTPTQTGGNKFYYLYKKYKRLYKKTNKNL